VFILDNKNNLIEAIVSNLEKLQMDKRGQKELKESIVNYVMMGDMQDYIINPQETIPNLDISTLYYIALHLNKVKAHSELQVDKYFTKREIKEIETNFEQDIEEVIEFPYTFKPAIRVGDGSYLLAINGKLAYQFMNSHLLQYNPDTQREGRKIKKANTDTIITVPKVNMKSVHTMADLAEKGELIESLITWNARLGSSDDESGEELIYDEENLSLTVTKGTLLDVLDGFHRLQATALALTRNPDLVIPFKLNILNFSKTQAQKYFAQLNTYNPVSKARVRELGESNYSDFVVKFIMGEFNDFKEKITHGSIAPRQEALTTFNILSDAIDKEFEMKNKKDAIQTARYLLKFFKELFYSFPDEFLGNILDIKKESIINIPSIFAGYVTLAKRMQQEDISIDEINNIISNIDFSRDNKQWQKLKVLDKKDINIKAKDNLISFFDKLDLTPYREKEGAK